MAKLTNKMIITLFLSLFTLLCCTASTYAADDFIAVASKTKGAVTAPSAAIYAEASTSAQQLLTLKFGEKVNMKSQSGNWCQVVKDHTRGYMKKDRLVLYDKTKKHIALTFDDGPSTKTTKTVLDALEQHKCRATFFVVGNRVDNGTKKLLKRADKLGCEIGNHSYSHPQLTGLSAAGVKNQLSKTDRNVKKCLGRKTTIFRPPYGSVNPSVLKVAKCPAILWSVDTLDWKYRDTHRLVSYVNSHAKDGAVVLMHDIYKTTANGTAAICKNLKKKHFEMVTVTELAAIRGKKMKPAKAYGSF